MQTVRGKHLSPIGVAQARIDIFAVSAASVAARSAEFGSLLI
jgi:hypothetical protein